MMPAVWLMILLASPAQEQLAQVEELLESWQFSAARQQAEELLESHPQDPLVRLQVAWVWHHFAEHQRAWKLIEDFLGATDDRRVHLIKKAAELSSQMVRNHSPDGLTVVLHRPGPEEVLLEPLYQVVGATLDKVGETLGHRAETPVRVEVLPDQEALAELTGLSLEAIRTSQTIAVCKFGRLLVTSPAATLTGYGWADTVSHELVHMIISQKTLNRTPIWLHEALARYLDTRWRADEPLYQGGLLPHAASRLARARRLGKLIGFEQMHPSMALLPSAEAAELAFAEVYTVADFIRQRWGFEGIRRVLELIASGRNDLEAIAEVTGLGREKFVSAWLKWLAGKKFVELEGEEDLQSLSASSAQSDIAGRSPQAAEHFHLGELLRARGRPQAAASEYRRALERAGDRHAAAFLFWEKLGLALQAAGEADEARKAFTRSLEQNPAGMEARLRLALLLADGDPQGAWWQLRQAERINPLDPRVHHLGEQINEKLFRQENVALYARELERHRRALKLLAGQVEANKPEPVDEGWAQLSVESRPRARVWLDGVDTGLTTPVMELRLSPGLHWVALAAECRTSPLVVPVFATGGKSYHLSEELCPSTKE